MFKKTLLGIFLLNNLDMALTIYGVHYLKTVEEINPLMEDLIVNNPIMACVVKNVLVLLVIALLLLGRKYDRVYTNRLTGVVFFIMFSVCVWNTIQLSI